MYYVCSAMFTLNGTENSLYIEDRRKAGGYGIEWSLDLTTLHITYNIKTKVENGIISEDVSNIIYNSDQTIKYSPSENYVLNAVTIDGTPIDIRSCPDEYEFKNITQDHEISVGGRYPVRLKVYHYRDRYFMELWSVGIRVYYGEVVGYE